MTDFQICVSESGETSESTHLVKQLVAFNDSAAPKEDWKPFFIALKDGSGALVGGAKGFTHWDWLYLSHLWVREGFRREGNGTTLLQRVEDLGRSRGCGNVWLDTFSFQGVGFYEKLGFEKFGELEDFPPGHRRLFLKKRI